METPTIQIARPEGVYVNEKVGSEYRADHIVSTLRDLEAFCD